MPPSDLQPRVSFMYFELPFISSYSLKFQLTILFILLIISYHHRGARLILACLATLYLVIGFSVPLIRWLYYLFKAIAMFGFYVHFFRMGLVFIFIGVEWVIHELEYRLEKLGRQEEREEDEGRRRRGRRRGGGR